MFEKWLLLAVVVVILATGYFGLWLRASINNAKNSGGLVPSVCERDAIGILHCRQCVEC